MIIHKTIYPNKKYVHGRGLVTNKYGRYVHRRGFLDSLIPMAVSFATNPQSAINVGTAVKELATSGFNVGKTIKDSISIAKPKLKNESIMKLIDDIKGIHIGKGFSKI
jgi:hypothetical protein